MSTATSPLRAGVIGAGVFGGYHAGKYAENPDTTLTAIFDPDRERAQALADKHGVTAYSEIGLFLEAVDVVTIASPGVTHAEMGARALEAGKPVLIEKPLAVTGEAADQLVKLAAERNLPLACGHQERLVFDVNTESAEKAAEFHLSLGPFRQVVKDYFQICESYFEAVKKSAPSQIETIDMARRGIHNEGSRVLQERLEGKAEIDTDTARRLFTLICVLHYGG